MNETIRSKLRDLRASSPVYSNAQLGAKLGYSGSVLSQYLSDDGCKYQGNIAELEKKAEDFLSALERRRTSGVETIPSKVAEAMLINWEYIRKTNSFGAIIAESGEGKTCGTEVICKKHTLAIYVRVTEWACDKFSLMQSLWKACAVDGWDRRSDRFGFLVTKMTGSDRPFLIDDAHKLSIPALSLLATFQEITGCPVAVVGIPELVKKLRSDPQLSSRTAMRFAITAGTGAKDGALIRHTIRSIAKDVNGELDELADLCGQIAAHEGGPRSVRQHLKLAAELRRQRDGLTWCQAVQKAHPLVLGEDAYQLT